MGSNVWPPAPAAGSPDPAPARAGGDSPFQPGSPLWESNEAALKQMFGGNAPVLPATDTVNQKYLTAKAEITEVQAMIPGALAFLTNAWLVARANAQIEPAPGSVVDAESNAALKLEAAFIDFTGTTWTSLPQVVDALKRWDDTYGKEPEGSPVPDPPAVPPNLLAYIPVAPDR